MGALRVFEAAARHLSFKEAAEELAVTPAAVSHHVRALESSLGIALFARRPGGVALTAEGERLYRRLHGAMLEIAQAIDDVRPRPVSGAVTVTTSASFAALWLVPRLGRFYACHPGIALRIDTDGAPVDLRSNGHIDVAIRYAGSDRPGLLAWCRLNETFGVYGAPAVVAQVRSAADRAAPELITVRWADSTLYDDGWQAWCEAAGESWLGPDVVMRAYDEENYALQAAIAGQGLVLASSVMMSNDVAAGLLAPYRPDVTVPGAAYTALCLPGRERHAPVRAFLGWLAAEWDTAGAAADGARARA